VRATVWSHSAQRDLVTEGSAISKAFYYSLKRRAVLSCYLDVLKRLPTRRASEINQLLPHASRSFHEIGN